MTALLEFVSSIPGLKLLLCSLLPIMLLSACAANLEGKFSLPKDAPAKAVPAAAPPAATGSPPSNAEPTAPWFQPYAFKYREFEK